MRSVVVAIYVVLFTFFTISCYAENTILMKFSVSYNPNSNPDSPHVRSVLKLKEEIERRTNGRVRIKIFWDDALATSYDVAVRSLKNGSIHLTQIPSGTMCHYSNGLLPLNTFFLIQYPHSQLAYRIIDGKVGAIVRDRVMNDTGMRILAFWDVGFRHITNNKKPLLTANSLEGLKIRVQPNPVHMDGFRRLKAEPVQISWLNLFASLQQGIAHASENTIANIRDARLYEVQKYLTLTGHAFEFVTFVMGEEFYQSLPDDVKQAVDKSVEVATYEYRERSAKNLQADINMLKEKMQINTLSPEEVEKFRKMVHLSNKIARDASGDEYYDKIISEVEIETVKYFETKLGIKR